MRRHHAGCRWAARRAAATCLRALASGALTQRLVGGVWQVLQLKKDEEDKRKREEQEERMRREREEEKLRKDRDREMRYRARQEEEVGPGPYCHPTTGGFATCCSHCRVLPA